MANDNRRPMSDLGKCVFDMMNNMNSVYVSSRDVADADHQRKLAALTPPITTVHINRRGEPNG